MLSADVYNLMNNFTPMSWATNQHSFTRKIQGFVKFLIYKMAHVREHDNGTIFGLAFISVQLVTSNAKFTILGAASLSKIGDKNAGNIDRQALYCFDDNGNCHYVGNFR